MNSTFKKTALFPSVMFLAAICVGMPTTVHAQQPGLVAILDVAQVFKDNTAFSGEMDRIKAKADQLKNVVTERQDTIKKDAQQLAGLERGTAERNQLEADLEKRQTELRTWARQTEEQLLNEEAQIYYDTYQQMQAVVEEVANRYNISLVLRFDSEEIDATNRNEVIKGVNRSVVYFHKLDLTKEVTTALNARVAGRPTAAPGVQRN